MGKDSPGSPGSPNNYICWFRLKNCPTSYHFAWLFLLCRACLWDSSVGDFVFRWIIPPLVNQWSLWSFGCVLFTCAMVRTQRWTSLQFHLGLSTLEDSQWMWHPDRHSEELLRQLSYFIFQKMSHYVAPAHLEFTTLLPQPLKWQITGPHHSNCCILTTESNTCQISFQIDFYQIKDISIIKSLLFFLHFWKKCRICLKFAFISLDCNWRQYTAFYWLAQSRAFLPSWCGEAQQGKIDLQASFKSQLCYRNKTSMILIGPKPRNVASWNRIG